MLLHSREFKADVMFTFQDVWPIDANPLFQMAKERKWIPYVPIDWFPVPPNILERLKKAYRVVTFSKAGHEALKNQGLQSILIPEAIDTSVFKPMDQKACRKEFGIPEDLFIFGMVAANKDDPPRKSFQQVMDAFVEINKKYPKTALYFQTMLEQSGGFNIKKYAEHLGITDKIYSPPPYDYLYKCPHAVVGKIINTFDVLLNPSNSEGFGLPIVESQACGVPAIVNDWASMPELIIPGKTGELCKTGYKVWTPIHSYKALPDLASLYEKMELLYKKLQDKKVKKQVAKDCRKFVVKNYNLEDRVRNTWLPFLEQLQGEILGKGGE